MGVDYLLDVVEREEFFMLALILHVVPDVLKGPASERSPVTGEGGEGPRGQWCRFARLQLARWGEHWRGVPLQYR